MNFLQLTQALHSLVRPGNDAAGTGPTSVTGQTGTLSELVAYIRYAWLDIQNDNSRWLFMIKQGQLTLPQSQDTISPSAISDLSEILLSQSDGGGRFIVLRDDDGSEHPCRYIPYADWAYAPIRRGEIAEGLPGYFTVYPDGRIQFQCKADRPYTVLLDYRRSNQTLAANNDTPIMPERYHMAIVWWALVNYYCTTREDAVRLEAKGKENLKREMYKLRNNQLEEPLMVEVNP